jgi:hypothetical protein
MGLFILTLHQRSDDYTYRAPVISFKLLTEQTLALQNTEEM